MKACVSELNQTQKYIMEIVKPVLTITDKLNITCWMQGGTMLGAIRHKGFIPWDDDIDLGMMRKDYDRFINEVEKYLPEHMELRTYNDDSNHHYYFARIVDNRHQIKRMGSAEVRYENVWIDIFPLDGMPNDLVSRAWHKIRLSFGRLSYHLACIEKVNIDRPGRPWIERAVIRTLLLLPHKKGNIIKRLDHVDRLLRKYPVEHSDWVINFMGQNTFKFTEMFKKDVYGKPTSYRFEDIELIGPEKYDEYLTLLYGNYMTPPEDKDKNAHKAELVK